MQTGPISPIGILHGNERSYLSVASGGGWCGPAAGETPPPISTSAAIAKCREEGRVGHDAVARFMSLTGCYDIVDAEQSLRLDDSRTRERARSFHMTEKDSAVFFGDRPKTFLASDFSPAQRREQHARWQNGQTAETERLAAVEEMRRTGMTGSGGVIGPSMRIPGSRR